VDLTVEFLLKWYPPAHVEKLLWTDGLPEYKTQAKSMAPKDLIREYGDFKILRESVRATAGIENPCVKR
jgi:hypothetical protein